MNKKLIFLFALFASLCMASSVLAVSIDNPLTGVDDFPALFTKLATGATGLVAALSSLMVIIGGMFFLLSAGNAGMVTRAKSILFFAFIGIIVALTSGAIISAVKGTTSSASGIEAVLTNIASTLGGLMAGLGTVMVIISGFFFLTSAGSPEKMKLARTVLIYAIMGIVIGLLASTIVSFVTGILK